MTVKDICIVTGLSETTVKDKIREFYPERCIKGRKISLTQEQAYKVVEDLRKKGFISKGDENRQVETKGDENRQVDSAQAIALIAQSFTKAMESVIARLDRIEQKQPLQIEMEQNYYSILAYCRKNDIKFTFSEAVNYGKCAVKKSKEMGYEIKRVPDERFGFVGSYHINVLREVFAL